MQVQGGATWSDLAVFSEQAGRGAHRFAYVPQVSRPHAISRSTWRGMKESYGCRVD